MRNPVLHVVVKYNALYLMNVYTVICHVLRWWTSYSFSVFPQNLRKRSLPGDVFWEKTKHNMTADDRQKGNKEIKNSEKWKGDGRKFISSHRNEHGTPVLRVALRNID